MSRVAHRATYQATLLSNMPYFISGGESDGGTDGGSGSTAAEDGETGGGPTTPADSTTPGGTVFPVESFVPTEELSTTVTIMLGDNATAIEVLTEEFGGVEAFNVSQVRDFSHVFANQTSAIMQSLDLKSWNVSSGSSFEGMFSASAFNGSLG